MVVFSLLFALAFSKEMGFTQEDRERLIRLETTLKTFMEQVDNRFEQVDKRISELREDMNNRFGQVDRRISELREDINDRFEQIDRRFEQINNELDRLVTIIVGVFGGQIALVGAVIAFAWWDRRTVIREAKKQTLEELERDIKPERLRKVLNVLRDKAKTDRELREFLEKEGLL